MTGAAWWGVAAPQQTDSMCLVSKDHCCLAQPSLAFSSATYFGATRSFSPDYSQLETLDTVRWMPEPNPLMLTLYTQ